MPDSVGTRPRRRAGSDSAPRPEKKFPADVALVDRAAPAICTLPVGFGEAEIDHARGMGFNALGVRDFEAAGLACKLAPGMQVILDLDITLVAPANDEAAGWWDTEIARMQAVGVSGFRCLAAAAVPGAVWARLIEAAKARTGIQSDSELLLYALSKVALEDDFGSQLLARKGSVPKDVVLDV